MNKRETPSKRRFFDRVRELNSVATPEEKALLDRELEEYRKNPEAGSTWDEVEARIRKPL